MNRFQDVTTCLEQALGGIHYERLDISDEVKEQVGTFIQNFHFPFKETSLHWSSGIYLFFFLLGQEYAFPSLEYSIYPFAVLTHS